MTKRRWLKSVITTSAGALPALPFSRKKGIELKNPAVHAIRAATSR
jgi:hypothetical protein